MCSLSQSEDYHSTILNEYLNIIQLTIAVGLIVQIIDGCTIYSAD